MISVVLTNFNGEKLLTKNLPKIFELLEKSKFDFELIVVDDASTDGSKVFLDKFKAEHGSQFTVIYKPKNEGFASTVDLGIRSAKGEFVFTLKTDTVPQNSDYFKILLDHWKTDKSNLSDTSVTSKLFAVSASLKTIENGKTELRGQGQIYFEKGFFLHRRKVTTSELTHHYSSWADGSASVFNKAIYEKIGGFDSLFNPFYWEDVDLGYRAWKAGYLIEYEPKAVLLHDHEKGAIKSHYSESQVKEISLRNQFIFVWKNADFAHLLQYFWWKTYHQLVALKNGQFGWFKSYFSALLKWPTILGRRIKMNKINILSDSQALANPFN